MKKPPHVGSAAAFMLAAVAIAFLAAAAVSQDTSGRLQDILESALRREALMDGVEASYTIESGLGGALAGFGGATDTGRGRGPQGNVALEASWAASGGQVMFDGAVSRDSVFAGGTSMRVVSDGDVARALLSSPDSVRGFVTPGEGPMARMAFVTPDKLGVTGLPLSPVSLAGMLSGETTSTTVRWGGQTRDIEIIRTPHYIGMQEIDGRQVAVVDVEESGMRGSSYQRLYFDPALNYAVVAAEQGRMVNNEFRAAVSWRFEDFQEVRPGLFMPFSAVSEAGRGRSAVPVVEFQLETIRFPGFLPEGLFDLEFPDGTVVRDTIANLSYTVGQLPVEDMDLALIEDYEVVPEVEVAAVPVEPAGATPEPVAEPSSYTFLIIVAIAAVVMGATGVVMYKKKHAG